MMRCKEEWGSVMWYDVPGLSYDIRLEMLIDINS